MLLSNLPPIRHAGPAVALGLYRPPTRDRVPAVINATHRPSGRLTAHQLRIQHAFDSIDTAKNNYIDETAFAQLCTYLSCKLSCLGIATTPGRNPPTHNPHIHPKPFISSTVTAQSQHIHSTVTAQSQHTNEPTTRRVRN